MMFITWFVICYDGLCACLAHMCVRKFFGSLECVNWKEEVKEINFNKFI